MGRCSPCATSFARAASKFRTIASGAICAGLASASKKSVLASEQDRPDVARRRVRWKQYQGGIDPKRLVFIDETSAKTNMAPLRGWGKRGDRVKAKAPFGHWNTMTFLAALRHDRIDAPWVFDGPINAEVFRTYVEQVLVPTLRPGDILRRENDPPDHFLILLTSTTSAATRRPLFAPPSGPQAQSSGSCHPTART